MRSLCTWLAGTLLAVGFMVAAPGCGGAASNLEKPPEVTTPPDPMVSMPGYKESQEKLKAQGKIK